MENKAIRLGIIGLGGMGLWHAQRINTFTPDGVAVAAYDIKEDRLQVAREHGLRAYDNLEDFLADPEINVVLVSTPNEYHNPMAIAAMNAGKHVICEKPVTLTVALLDEMIAASKANNVLFTVHQNRRGDRDYLRVRSGIDSGKVGKPIFVESRVYAWNGLMFGWRGKAASGGGMLYDWGIHLIDQILVMNPPEENKLARVFCQMFTVCNEECDDLFKADLVFENGFTAHCEVGTFHQRKYKRWLVYGDDGTMEVDDFEGNGGITHCTQHVDPEGMIVVDGPSGPTRMMATRPEYCAEELPLDPVQENTGFVYRNLAEILQGKASELAVTPASVRRTLLTIEACQESARTGKAIEMNI